MCCYISNPDLPFLLSKIARRSGSKSADLMADSHLGIRDLSSRALEVRRRDGDAALLDDIFVPSQNIHNAVVVDQADVADFTRTSTLTATEVEASSCASRATSNVILSGAVQ